MVAVEVLFNVVMELGMCVGEVCLDAVDVVIVLVPVAVLIVVEFVACVSNVCLDAVDVVIVPLK